MAKTWLDIWHTWYKSVGPQRNPVGGLDLGRDVPRKGNGGVDVRFNVGLWNRCLQRVKDDPRKIDTKG